MKSKSRMTPPAPVSNLSSLPFILTLREVAAIYRLSDRTIRRDLERNEFRPMPYDKYPYRWRRDDVIRDLNGPSRKMRRRAHGFATTKRQTHDATK